MSRARLYRIDDLVDLWKITVYKWKPKRQRWRKLYVFTSSVGATMREAIAAFKAHYVERRGTTYRRRLGGYLSSAE